MMMFLNQPTLPPSELLETNVETLSISAPAQSQAAQMALPLLETLFQPRVGVRAGLGSADGNIGTLGLDVTFKAPFVGFLPALRFDAEVFSQFPIGGSGRYRGGAVSIMGVQSIGGLGYVAAGPTWYRTVVGANDRLGAKVLVGTSLLNPIYVEGSAILGPSRTPITVSVGYRF